MAPKRKSRRGPPSKLSGRKLKPENHKTETCEIDAQLAVNPVNANRVYHQSHCEAAGRDLREDAMLSVRRS